MNNYKILTTPRAQQDIENIADYIGKKLFAPSSAQKFLDNVINTYDKLSVFPEMGTEVKQNFPLKYKYRWIPIDNYLLFYIIKDEQIVVMRVLFSSMNYMNILE